MWGIHEKRETTMNPMGLSGKLMMQLEEKALQQEERTGKEGGKDSSSQPGRKISSQKHMGSWTLQTGNEVWSPLTGCELLPVV